MLYRICNSNTKQIKIENTIPNAIKKNIIYTCFKYKRELYFSKTIKLVLSWL